MFKLLLQVMDLLPEFEDFDVLLFVGCLLLGLERFEFVDFFLRRCVLIFEVLGSTLGRIFSGSLPVSAGYTGSGDMSVMLGPGKDFSGSLNGAQCQPEANVGKMIFSKNGSPLRFFLYPSTKWGERKESNIWSIKKNGGQIVQRDQIDAETLILVVDEGDGVAAIDKRRWAQQFYNAAIVEKSSRRNELQPLELYQLSFQLLPSGAQSRLSPHKAVPSEAPKQGSPGAAAAQSSSQGTTGRTRYSDEEDGTILRYVSSHQGDQSLKGNAFWRGLERRQILPGRTFQSLRSRYMDHLQNLSKRQKQELINFAAPHKSTAKRKMDDSSKTKTKRQKQIVASDTEISELQTRTREDTSPKPKYTARQKNMIKLIEQASQELKCSPAVVIHALFGLSGDVRKMYQMLTPGEGLTKHGSKWGPLNVKLFSWADSKLMEAKSTNSAQVDIGILHLYYGQTEFYKHARFKEPSNSFFNS
eukprot:g38173.t1